jgi:hypothetical protein
MSEINLTHQMALIISKKGKFIAFGQDQKAPKRGHHNRMLIVFNPCPSKHKIIPKAEDIPLSRCRKHTFSSTHHPLDVRSKTTKTKLNPIFEL